MGYEIRELCHDLLVDRIMHPAEIGAAIGAPMGEVQAALHHGWDTFCQVADAQGFLWTRSDSAIARSAQRAVVAGYIPCTYSKPARAPDGYVGGGPTRCWRGGRSAPATQLSGANALGRALYAKGSGTIEELAAHAGCRVATIRQQASRFSRFLTTSRELMTSPEGNRYWRTVRVALKVQE